MRLAQITDFHLLADPAARSRVGFPLAQLEAVVAAVNRQQPAQVLVTGDISQDETAGSYRLAAQVLAELEAPWCWLPGNHDRPALMAEWQALPAELELGGWRALLLDTHVDGCAHGELGEAALAALATRLAADERPTLVVMHHHPLAVGSAWIDAIGLVEPQAFWQVLSPHRHVQAVFCGHVHQAFHGVQMLGDRALPVYGCPATSDQFLPGVDDFAVDEASRPGYRLIDLGDETLTTWVERVDV